MSVESFTHVAGRQVISADNAESMGTVRSFVLDRRGRTIEGIHIAGRGRNATVLGWAHVTAFGADAVMVSESRVSAGPVDDHERAAVSGNVSMIGSRVLSTDGDMLGQVADVEFDTETGAIISATTDHGPYEATRFRSLGSFALVVDPSTPGP